MNFENNKKIQILFNGMLELDEEGEVVGDIAGLKQIALKQLPYNDPEISIILAISEQAALEGDKTYIESDLFSDRLYLIGLNGIKVRDLIYKIWSN